MCHHTALLPFRGSIRRPRYWLYWVLGTHFALMIMVFVYLPRHLWILGLIPLSLWLALAPAGWLPGCDRITAIQVDNLGQLSIQTNRYPDWQTASIVPDTYLSLPLMILSVRTASRPYRIMLWADNTDASLRRHLHLYLRWHPSTHS